VPSQTLLPFGVACLICALSAVDVVWPPPVTDLLRLMEAPVGSGVPPEWHVRAVRRFDAPSSWIVDSAGTRFLRIAGTRQAAWFVHQLRRPLPPNTGRLQWTWRAPLSPVGASASSPATDDAALRVFVVFERHSRFARTPRALFYTLSDGEASTRLGQSGPMVSLPAGRPGAARDWVSFTADPARDYQRIWGDEVPPLVAVGLMQDTDQTMRPAIGEVSRLEWRGVDRLAP
jgi:hypothetical protein